MEFEHDFLKDELNYEKHGIGFEDARQVWNDGMCVELPSKFVQGEERFMVIGQIDGKCWSVIVTYRDGKVRIISARRSRKKEVKFYEGH